MWITNFKAADKGQLCCKLLASGSRGRGQHQTKAEYSLETFKELSSKGIPKNDPESHFAKRCSGMTICKKNGLKDCLQMKKERTDLNNLFQNMQKIKSDI